MENKTSFGLVRLFVVFTLFSLHGCATTSGKDVCPKPPGEKSEAIDLRGSLLEHIPARAVFAAVVRPSAYSGLTRWFASQKELKQAILDYTKDEASFDNTKGVVLYADGLSKDSAIAIVSPLAEERDTKVRRKDQPPAFTYQQVPVYAMDMGLFHARWPGFDVLGTKAGIQLAIDRSLGKVPALSEKDPLAILFKVDRANTEVMLAADVTTLPQKQALSKLGVERAAITFDADKLLSAFVAGPPQRLVGARMAVGLAASQALEKVKQQMEQAKAAKKDGQALASITSYYLLKSILEETAPKSEDGMLVSRYKLPEINGGTAMFVSFAGILAAVAVPAFIKYIRKSKTIEAVEGLQKIAAGAKIYYQADHYSKRGVLLPRQFPPAESDWTPSTPCCEGQENKCLAPEQWERAPWQLLQFKLQDPHYYQWRYRSAGKGKQATFEAEARGDLDCDGVYSSFKISGKVDESGQVVISGPVITDEIE